MLTLILALLCLCISVSLYLSLPLPLPSSLRVSLKVALQSALTRIDRLEIAGGEQEQRVEAAIGRVEAAEAQKEGGSRSEMVRHLQQVRRPGRLKYERKTFILIKENVHTETRKIHTEKDHTEIQKLHTLTHELFHTDTMVYLQVVDTLEGRTSSLERGSASQLEERSSASAVAQRVSEVRRTSWLWTC